jgi:hypothetical protein
MLSCEPYLWVPEQPQEASRQLIGAQRRFFFGLLTRSNEPALEFFSEHAYSAVK